MFEDEKEWPYPLLPCCPVCRSPSILYFPYSDADTTVYCTRCKWKAAVKHIHERRPTIDGLPDVHALHEAHAKRAPTTSIKAPKRPTINGMGPPLAPADPIELGPAGGTKKPTTNFVAEPDPEWASKPIPGIPYPEIDDAAMEEMTRGLGDLPETKPPGSQPLNDESFRSESAPLISERTMLDEVLELDDDDLPDPSEWEEGESPIKQKRELPEG